MVTGFEKYTKALTDYEVRTITPYIVSRLRNNVGVSKAVHAKKIIKTINDLKNHYTTKSGKSKCYRLTGPKLRQIIHHIRVNNLIKNLVATHKGYYVASNKKELEDYIESLKQRRNSFEEVRRAMSEQLLLSDLN
jgi:hypothetical protein